MDDQACEAAPDTRTCSCHPDERPEPCPRQFAYHHCWRAAVRNETQRGIVTLKNQDRSPLEQAFLEYLMRVRTALEV